MNQIASVLPQQQSKFTERELYLAISIMIGQSTLITDNIKHIHIDDPLEGIIIDIFQEMGETIDKLDDLEGIIFQREQFHSSHLYPKLQALIPKVKRFLTSSSLTSLQGNAEKKQKNAALNFYRQILRTRGYRLKPFVVSQGYDKTNGRKITKRFYRVEKITG